MFLRLGFTNITRQLGRSILALLSLVLAAMSLTNSLSISQGYPATAFSHYRDYFGGDILIFPTNIMGNPEHKEDLALHRLKQDTFSSLTTLYPHVTREGFLTPRPPLLTPFTESSIQGLLKQDKIKEVNSLYRMPGWRLFSSTDRLQVSLRSLPKDSGLWQYLEEAQPNGETAVGKIQIWLNAQQPKERPLPPVGSEIELLVPRIWLSEKGELHYDTQSGHTQWVQVAGYYTFPTRTISWPNPNGDGFFSEQGYFNHDEVWLEPEAWQTLWNLAGYSLPLQAGSLGLKVYDMSILEATVSELQLAHPEWTITSAPNLVQQAERGALLDTFYTAPAEHWAEREPQGVHAFPVDIGRVLSFFIYLNAGLLMAARMLTGAAARKKEIGILKTLGARRRDVITMALAEAVVLAVIGSTLGFILSYPAAVFQQITNNVAWSRIAALWFKNYGIVLLETLVIGVAFGLLPAWRLSKLTVNEVLRS